MAKTHGQRAAQQASRATALFDDAVSGLNEARRLLELERDQAGAEYRFHLEQADNAALRADSANEAHAQHGRVIAKIQDLVG